MTVLPRRVGSFFTSRSSERSKLRAVASRRSMSSRRRSRIDIRCRLGGSFGGSRRSRITRMSAIGRRLLRCGYEQDTVDLIDLDELHLDPFVPMCREILAHVVRPDREL